MGSSSTKHFHHHSLMLSFQTRIFSLIFSKYVISSCACIWTIYIIRRMFHLKSYYDRIIQVRRDIRRFLVEPSTQSRGNYGGSCSGSCQILVISKDGHLHSTTSPDPYSSLWSLSRFFFPLISNQNFIWFYLFFYLFLSVFLLCTSEIILIPFSPYPLAEKP